MSCNPCFFVPKHYFSYSPERHLWKRTEILVFQQCHVESVTLSCNVTAFAHNTSGEENVHIKYIEPLVNVKKCCLTKLRDFLGCYPQFYK